MTWLLDDRSRPIPVRAGRAGSPASRPAGRTMPDLVPVVPEPPYGDGGACAWLTAEPVAEPSVVWRRLARIFDDTGLWPLATPGWERPFRVGAVSGPAACPTPRPSSCRTGQGSGS